MIQTLSLEILGIPKPKQSARFRIMKNKAGKQFISSYQKKDVVDNEANIGYTVIQQLPEGFIPFDCPIHMDVEFVFPTPKSMSKKLKYLISEGVRVYKDTKPDLPDNCSKGVVDSLAGIVFVNDSRIASMKAVKYYGLIPKIIIKFTVLTNS